MTLIYDLETNGYYKATNTIHCMAIYDTEEKRMYSYADQDGYAPIKAGLEHLVSGECIVAHNNLCFDAPVLKKLYPKMRLPKLRDTLILSKLKFPDRQYHSLDSWGRTLGEMKTKYTKGFEKWNQSMHDYCIQDVWVLVKLWDRVKDISESQSSVIEHDFQSIIFKQEQQGIHFDLEKAFKLQAVLQLEKEKLVRTIEKAVPTRTEKTPFIPKVNNSRYGYTKGVKIYKEAIITFNPGSRQQITKYLKDRYAWEPMVFTDKGAAKVTGSILSALPWMEAKLFAEFLDNQKVLSFLANGDNAWLKMLDNGKIHGKVWTLGTRTRRCSHANPNLAQVPAHGSYMGEECRDLFIPPTGMVMVGCDASQLELRMLAHYVSAYDDGAMTKELLKGDIHTKNRRAAGLSNRDLAKTFIYAFNYGAGDAKLGSIVEPTASVARKRQIGGMLRMKFLASNPAIKRLLHQVHYMHKVRGHFIGLDGGKLLSISEHSSLNTLLQGAGAVVMKLACNIFWRSVKAQEIEAYPVLNVHDEYQQVCYQKDAELVGKLATDAIRKAGEELNLKCPLDGEYKIGNSWKETH